MKADDRLMCIGAGLLISCIAHIGESKIYISEYGKPYAKNGIFSMCRKYIPKKNHIFVDGRTYYFSYGIFENKSIAVSSTVDL